MQAQPAQSTPIAVSNEDDVLTGTIRVIPDLTTALPGDNNVHKWADKSIHVARSLHEWWGRARATIDTADILRVRYTPGSGRRNIELVEPHKDYIWLGSKAWRSDNPPELEQGPSTVVLAGPHPEQPTGLRSSARREFWGEVRSTIWTISNEGHINSRSSDESEGCVACMNTKSGNLYLAQSLDDLRGWFPGHPYCRVRLIFVPSNVQPSAE